MKSSATVSLKRVFLPVGLGTGLSLIGDSSLYTVLPIHTLDAGVPLASVGILLSANRFIRLALNGPAGLAYDRWPRRRLFVAALFVGAISTGTYALTRGFWPLLIGRLLWGLAWSGIWIGGNTIILDVSGVEHRGRRVGAYQISFFLGAAAGTVLGGSLTDWLGYHAAMGVGASLTFLGAVFALLFLPETRGLSGTLASSGSGLPRRTKSGTPRPRGELASATALLAVSRFAVPGVLFSTLSLFLLQQLGDPVQIAGRTLGVATFTGMLLGLNALIGGAVGPVVGSLSDRLGDRWRVAAGGMLPGVAGFGLVAAGSSWAALVGVPLAAVAGGSNQGLATTLVGDLGTADRFGRRLGMLFTVGDLASAVGPPLAYTVLPILGLRGLYLLNSVLFALILLVALYWSVRATRKRAAAGELP